jgi:hypothetical protein
MLSWTTAVSTSGGAAVRYHASPTNSNFTLRAARNTAARGKGTIYPHASQLVPPHNQPLPTAGKRPVPVADSISNAVTLTAGLLYGRSTLVGKNYVHFKRTSR